MFKRMIDFHLRNWKEDPYRKPLLLRGARQVGKTHAVRRLGGQFKYFVEVNFERLEQAKSIFEKDLVPERIVLALSLILKTPIIPKETLLFFDEIQEAPKAILALRYFFEEMPELHVIAAGSLLEFAVEKVGLPVGRISTLYMYPMCFMEYLVATNNSRLAAQIMKQQPGISMDESIHAKLIDLVGEYLSIGGMPEALSRWVETQNPESAILVLKQISETYRQDFEKYARKSQIKYLEQLFRQIPHLTGKEFSYKAIHGEFRKRELAPALELLERANLIHFVRYASGQGIPIGADIDFDIFKVLYLDTGLNQVILGSDVSVWFLNPLSGFENKGELAEAFVGQELICYTNNQSKAEIHFWKRKEKNSTAEVDYLLQSRESIIPIEVKSGHGNTLKSMRMFLDTHKRSTYGIRFSTQNYSVFDLIDSRPLYAVATLAHPSQIDAINWLIN